MIQQKDGAAALQQVEKRLYDVPGRNASSLLVTDGSCVLDQLAIFCLV